jgi:transcriptional regulator
MRRRTDKREGDLLGGTLDMLVLRTLQMGAAHGFAIALSIGQRSGEQLLVEEGSLYPALHRLEERGWIQGAWGTTENNRRARFYSLTPAGRRQLSTETERWRHLVAAVTRVMEPSS